MAKRTRSPNFPGLSLSEAIKRADELYQREKKAPVPATNAVEAWGYTGLHGVSLRIIGALRQYGLLDVEGDDVRVSDRAMQILFPENPETKLRALRKASRGPRIFSELLDEYGDSLPSDASLKSVLINKKGLTDTAADRFIQAFRETLKVAKADDNAYSFSKGAQDEAPKKETQVDPEKSTYNQQPVVGKWNKSYTCPVSDATTAVITITGEKPTQEELDILWDYIEILKRTIRVEKAGQTKEENNNFD